jgi:hypothetical protein
MFVSHRLTISVYPVNTLSIFSFSGWFTKHSPFPLLIDYPWSDNLSGQLTARLYSTDFTHPQSGCGGFAEDGSMSTIRTAIRTACVLTLAAVLGCGGQVKLVPVTGVVKLDGKPVDGVRVYFWPKDQSAKTFVNQFAIGFSDKAGKFSLRGTNGDGIEAGEYRVTFARPMTGVGKATAKPNQKGEEVGAKETLPPDLTELSRTKHTASVSEASHDFTFDLTSQ